MHELAERLLRTIRKQQLIQPGERVAAAVSGGADSVALLLLLLDLRAELGIVLSVAHVNHKLRGQASDADEQFVQHLAEIHSLDCHSVTAPLRAGEPGIEAAARKLRYDFFQKLAVEQRIAKVATAHTLDDQAETVLMRILRGTGIRGLAGIHPRRNLFEASQVPAGHTVAEVVRPLLDFRRDELRKFLHLSNRIWREDSSNLDPQFFRNRIRHEVMPFLSTLSGAVAENLADLAEIARGEEEHWDLGHPEIRGQTHAIEIASLLALPLASQRRLIRKWLETHASEAGVSFRQIEEVLDLTLTDAGKTLEIGAGYQVRRGREHLHLEVAGDEGSKDYEYALQVPGVIEVPEIGMRIEAAVVDAESIPESERDFLLEASRVSKSLVVRNWRAGDRFWPAHTKEAKKVKDLLNDRHITGPGKKLWPVITAGNELVWMRGFPVPSAVQAPSDSTRAIWIREVALS